MLFRSARIMKTLPDPHLDEQRGRARTLLVVEGPIHSARLRAMPNLPGPLGGMRDNASDPGGR